MRRLNISKLLIFFQWVSRFNKILEIPTRFFLEHGHLLLSFHLKKPQQKNWQGMPEEKGQAERPALLDVKIIKPP